MLRLPAPPTDLNTVVFENESEARDLAANEYGLYAIIVHSGVQLTGGHYYVYARDSDGDLTVPDRPEYVSLFFFLV